MLFTKKFLRHHRPFVHLQTLAANKIFLRSFATTSKHHDDSLNDNPEYVDSLYAAAPISEAADPLLEPPSFSKSFPSSLPRDFQRLSLLDSWSCAKEHKILRFSLPSGTRDLSLLGVPSGVKVRQTISNEVLDKSYSPISHPTVCGHLDLLIKRYPFRQGGGLGDWLYCMEIGDTIDIKLKPEKLFNGEPYHRNRWKQVVLIGNGTGVAPLYQLALSILSDPEDHTMVWYVSQHADGDDLLMEDNLRAMKKEHGHRFSCHVMLTRHNMKSGSTVVSGRGAGRLGMDEVNNVNIFPSPNNGSF